ncbi:MAG: S49 family peptidase, partial [Verrucomicrobiota bacterium]
PDGKLRNSIADGRIISGQDALSQGLIDQTGYLEDAYARARELANAPNAKVIRFSEETSLGEALGLMKAKLFGQPAAEVELRIPGLPTTELQPGVPYLLPPTYAP